MTLSDYDDGRTFSRFIAKHILFYFISPLLTQKCLYSHSLVYYEMLEIMSKVKYGTYKLVYKR